MPNRLHTKHRLRNTHTCKLTNECNRINAYEHNELVENWYRVKSSQINKLPKKENITNSY